ncbi:MAG: outer membrane beta-barrel protein [Pseudomonadota bacterium]
MFKHSTALLIAFAGCTATLVPVEQSLAQSANNGSLLPDASIRGSIFPQTGQTTQNDAFSGSGPVVLGAQTEAAIPEPTVETYDDFDLATEEGQRDQLTRRNRTEPTPTRPLQQRAQRAQATGPVTFDPESPGSPIRANVAAEPVQGGGADTLLEDPFSPTGFRLGIFEGQASLEQSVGYSSNVSQRTDGDGGAFSQSDLTLSLISDWSRHQWRSSLAGTYRRPFDSEETDDIFLFADSGLRLDLLDGFTLTGTVNYSMQSEEFTSTTLVPGAIDTPLTHTYGGAIELERLDRKVLLALRGSIQRTSYEDADLGGGFTQSQEDQNNNLTSFSLRAGYEISPAVIPFIEGIIGSRSYDEIVDRNGNRRDSDIYELRAGVQVDLGEKIEGEISVGYLTEEFDDPRLDDLNGFTINGLLNWSPERDTLISLTLGTQTNNSISANENGSLTYTGRLEIERQITNRFSVNGFAGFEFETNEDDNRTLEIGVGTEYWVNRFLAVTTDLEYQTFTADNAGSDFDEVSGRVGVRLQR